MQLKEIKLPFTVKKAVLALGSQAKNTLCFAKGNYAVFSPMHPDLTNPKDFLDFERRVKYFLKKKPRIIACDLHPEYQSTKIALTLSTVNRKLLTIQHHHAHIASCMADNGLANQKVIGVAFDGTGLGSDNTLWGAEFLLSDYKNFKRAAHLKQIPLLGGEKAIWEPARLAIAWLYQTYKDKFLNLKIKPVKNLRKERWRVFKNMYLSGTNSPLASSMGRLFDAVGSLVLGKGTVNFEAELAIELEKIAIRYTLHATRYKFNIIKDKGKYIIDPSPLFEGIISDLARKEAKAKIAYRFHLTLAEMIRRMCLRLRKETNINKVVLSGGVFQNSLLLRLSLDLLYKEDFQVLAHKNLSCSDSGISLGQMAIANFRCEKCV